MCLSHADLLQIDRKIAAGAFLEQIGDIAFGQVELVGQLCQAKGGIPVVFHNIGFHAENRLILGGDPFKIGTQTEGSVFKLLQGQIFRQVDINGLDLFRTIGDHTAYTEQGAVDRQEKALHFLIGKRTLFHDFHSRGTERSPGPGLYFPP